MYKYDMSNMSFRLSLKCTFSLKVRDGGLMPDIAAGQVHRYSPLAAPPARRI